MSLIPTMLSPMSVGPNLEFGSLRFDHLLAIQSDPLNPLQGDLVISTKRYELEKVTEGALTSYDRKYLELPRAVSSFMTRRFLTKCGIQRVSIPDAQNIIIARSVNLNKIQDFSYKIQQFFFLLQPEKNYFSSDSVFIGFEKIEDLFEVQELAHELGINIESSALETKLGIPPQDNSILSDSDLEELNHFFELPENPVSSLPHYILKTLSNFVKENKRAAQNSEIDLLKRLSKTLNEFINHPNIQNLGIHVKSTYHALVQKVVDEESLDNFLKRFALDKTVLSDDDRDLGKINFLWNHPNPSSSERSNDIINDIIKKLQDKDKNLSCIKQLFDEISQHISASTNYAQDVKIWEFVHYICVIIKHFFKNDQKQIERFVTPYQGIFHNLLTRSFFFTIPIDKPFPYVNKILSALEETGVKILHNYLKETDRHIEEIIDQPSLLTGRDDFLDPKTLTLYLEHTTDYKVDITKLLGAFSLLTPSQVIALTSQIRRLNFAFTSIQIQDIETDQLQPFVYHALIIKEYLKVTIEEQMTKLLGTYIHYLDQENLEGSYLDDINLNLLNSGHNSEVYHYIFKHLDDTNKIIQLILPYHAQKITDRQSFLDDHWLAFMVFHPQGLEATQNFIKTIFKNKNDIANNLFKKCLLLAKIAKHGFRFLHPRRTYEYAITESDVFTIDFSGFSPKEIEFSTANFEDIIAIQSGANITQASLDYYDSNHNNLDKKTRWLADFKILDTLNITAIKSMIQIVRSGYSQIKDPHILDMALLNLLYALRVKFEFIQDVDLDYTEDCERENVLQTINEEMTQEILSCLEFFCFGLSQIPGTHQNTYRQRVIEQSEALQYWISQLKQDGFSNIQAVLMSIGEA